jgi:hypothetical protein
VAVRDFPMPSNTKLKAFLRLTRYNRKFVPRFSLIAKPLSKLMGKNVPYVWGEEQEIAFQTLEHILCNEPLLQYSDFEKEFIVTCESKSNGIGSMLSQGSIRKDLPVAYASHLLTTLEKNCSITDKELMTIV